MTDNHTAPHTLTTLARTCMAHLRHEAQSLQQTVDLLDRAASALLAGDYTQLAVVNEQQIQAESELARVQQQRTRLRNTLAGALEVPPQKATVRALAARLQAPLHNELMAQRDRVAALADRVQALTRHNLMFIAQGIQVLNELVVLMTGREPDLHRYAASGRRLPASYPAVWQEEY